MADIAEASQKKLKSRIRSFKKCIKSDEEKEKFFNKLGISFTINMPDADSEMEKMATLYTNPDGNITFSEYVLSDEESFNQEHSCYRTFLRWFPGNDAITWIFSW